MTKAAVGSGVIAAAASVHARQAGLFIDEAQNGLDPAALLRGGRFPVVVDVGPIKARSRETLLRYLIAASFRVGGIQL